MANSFAIIINGRRFEVELPRLQGSQIRALAAVPDDHSLVVECADDAPDYLLADDQWIDLGGSPVVMYSIPPTTFG